MTVSPDTSAPSTVDSRAARRPSRHRGEGQWALGHREPLNANERVKADDDGLNVRRRVETIYAVNGFASIDPTDLNGRLRWWGLYTQRRPGIPGGETATLEPHELSDEYFMLRIRSDGGQLNADQVAAIGSVSSTYARDTADITDRQNIQLHWVRIEDVPAIWRALEDVRLTTAEACGDTPRVVLGSPLAGVAADEIVDGSPAIDEIVRRYVADPQFANLPRKFKSAVSGSPWQDVAHEVNDLSFIGVVHPDHGPGFDVWVGGGLSTNPMLAQRLGAFVPLDDVADVWAGVVQLFRDYGYRRLRHRARLKFLVADWGVARFRQVLEDEYLDRTLLDGPAPPAPPAGRDHVGVHEQADGRYYVGAAPLVGRISATTLVELAALMREVGSDRLRLTPHQKLVLLDVKQDDVETVVTRLAALGLHARPSGVRRSTMACTGLEFCKLAIVETKHRAAALVEELERRLPADAAPLSIHVNGCPNSCARIQVADIGLKGVMVTDDQGRRVEGFQVHLGGALGRDASFGRKARGLRVTSEQLGDFVAAVATRYTAQRRPDESFAHWAHRVDDAQLTGQVTT